MPHTAQQKIVAAIGKAFQLSDRQIQANDSQLHPLAPAMGRSAIGGAQKRQATYGDAARKKPRVDVGTLTHEEKLVIIQALAEDSTLHTAAGTDTLQERVRRKSGRTVPQSTIDDYVRATGVTSKVAEPVNPRRDAYESAQRRADVRAYPLHCILNIDATNIANADFDRRRGRAPAGQPAQLRTERMPGTGLRCIYAAMNIYGMERSACRIIEGAVDGATFMDYVSTRT